MANFRSQGAFYQNPAYPYTIPDHTEKPLPFFLRSAFGAPRRLRRLGKKQKFFGTPFTPRAVPIFLPHDQWRFNGHS